MIKYIVIAFILGIIAGAATVICWALAAAKKGKEDEHGM